MRHLLILIALSIAVQAQVDHLGILYSHAGSDGKDGNGGVNGVVIQGRHSFGWPAPPGYGLSAAGEAKWSRDYKGYLNETGTAFRGRVVGRFEYGGIFAQAGVYGARVRFANTSASVQNGYGKSVVQPIIGFGYHYPNAVKFDTSFDYLYFLKGNLHASDSTGKALGIDGTSKTHRIGLNTSYEFAPKWLLLTNVSWNRSTYVRQCGYYSADLCGTPHASQGWEVQFGIGRKF